MNWLAWDPRSYGGAALGALLGACAYLLLRDSGFDEPWLVGLALGLGCALMTRERSGLRGIVLACTTAWLAAGLTVAAAAPAEGWVGGMASFHASLALPELTRHLVGIAAACLLGRTSLRRGASDRVAGQGRETPA
ncbi:MAG: hypothetical protein O2894_06470 [Planctomycetota bacterium]|nr:hypothetical protein [Planctomycetota bacterium]